MTYFVFFAVAFVVILLLSVWVLFFSSSSDRGDRDLQNRLQIKDEETARLKTELSALREVHEGLKAQYEELDETLQESKLKELQ